MSTLSKSSIHAEVTSTEESNHKLPNSNAPNSSFLDGANYASNTSIEKDPCLKMKELLIASLSKRIEGINLEIQNLEDINLKIQKLVEERNQLQDRLFIISNYKLSCEDKNESLSNESVSLEESREGGASSS